MKKIISTLILFTLFTQLNAQVLSELHTYSNNIRNITFEGNSAWLASSGGWYQVDLQGNVLNHYYTNTKVKLPEYYTYKIVVGPDKKKYSTDFGTGLTQFDGVKFIKLTPPTNYNITYYGNLFSDDKGVHTITNAGLLSYDGTNWSLLNEYTDKNNVSQKLNATLQAYSKDNKGNIWLLNDKSILKYDGKSWVIFELLNLPNKPSSIFELVLKNNTVYVSSNVGLLVYENNVWKVFDNKNGLYSYSISGINTINGVSDDSNGNTWVITSGNPNLIINGVVSNQLIPKDLFGKNITKVANCPNGDVWFGTEKKGVLSLDKNYSAVKTVFEDKNPTLASDAMKSAFQDTKGNKYFLNSNYTGVTRFDGQKWETTPLQFLLKDGTKTPLVNPNSMAEDSKGRIWISTTNALFMFDGTEWNRFGINEGLPIINVRGLCVDKQDNIWVGGTIYRQAQSTNMMALNGILF